MYLGTLLSYDPFERQSEELRVQAGWNNFKRLQPWLCRKHKISLQLRLELMRTCIIPTICYGIFSLVCNKLVFNLYAKHYITFTGKLLAIFLLVPGNTFHCTWEISHWAAIDCPAQVGKPGLSESDWSTDLGAFTWCYSPDQLEHTERYQEIANIRALQTCCISWIRLRTWRSCMHLLCFHCLKPSWTSETSHATTWFAEAIHPPGWLSTGHQRWNATMQTL